MEVHVWFAPNALLDPSIQLSDTENLNSVPVEQFRRLLSQAERPNNFVVLAPLANNLFHVLHLLLQMNIDNLGSSQVTSSTSRTKPAAMKSHHGLLLDAALTSRRSR